MNIKTNKIRPVNLSTLNTNIQCEHGTNLTANRNWDIPFRNFFDIWYSDTTQPNNKQFNGSINKQNDKPTKRYKHNCCH